MIPRSYRNNNHQTRIVTPASEGVEAVAEIVQRDLYNHDGPGITYKVVKKAKP